MNTKRWLLVSLLIVLAGSITASALTNRERLMLQEQIRERKEQRDRKKELEDERALNIKNRQAERKLKNLAKKELDNQETKPRTPSIDLRVLRLELQVKRLTAAVERLESQFVILKKPDHKKQVGGL